MWPQCSSAVSCQTMCPTRIHTSRKPSVECTARMATCSSPPAKVNSTMSNLRIERGWIRSDFYSECLFKAAAWITKSCCVVYRLFRRRGVLLDFSHVLKNKYQAHHQFLFPDLMINEWSYCFVSKLNKRRTTCLTTSHLRLPNCHDYSSCIMSVLVISSKPWTTNQRLVTYTCKWVLMLVQTD